MREWKRALFAGVLAAIAVGVVSVPAVADEKGKPNKPEQPDAAKPIIIQIDGSKLPPEVLKELLKLSKTSEPTKPGTKPEPTKPESTKPGTKPEPTKPGTKPEPTKPTGKPSKVISLSEAIAIAEKATGGTAVKAERENEDGGVEFEIGILDEKGNKVKVTVDGTGKVLKTEKKGEKGDNKDEKGKKKTEG